MPAQQCQMFFFDQGKVWCETFYFVANELTDGMNALNTLALARRSLVGAKVSIGKLRVSVDPPDRNVLEAGMPPPVPVPDSDLPWNSVILDIFAAGGPSGRIYERAMSLRGLPTGIHDRQSPWWTQIYQWAKMLVSLKFCMRVQDRDQESFDIVGMEMVGLIDVDCAGNPLNPDSASDSSLSIIITTREPHNIPLLNPFTGKPSYVNIRGCKWQEPDGQVRTLYSATLKVLGVQPFAICVEGRLPATGSLKTAGKVRLAQVAYYPFTKVRVKFDPTRRTGGRSKVKPSIALPWNPTYQLVNELELPPETVYDEPTEIYVPPPPLPPQPISQTIRSAYDLIQLVEEGYFAHPDGVKYQITITRVLNMPNTWLVVASGTDLTVDAATGITEDILAGIGAFDAYVGSLVTAVTAAIPNGGNLILAGDSLGGMEVQNLLKYLPQLKCTCSNLITFNSPQTTMFYFADKTVRFAERGDLVISATPVGLLLAVFLHPEQTFVKDSPGYLNPVTAHKAIYTDENLASYDAVGNDTSGIGGVFLELGTQFDFQATPFGPKLENPPGVGKNRAKKQWPPQE